MKDGHWVKEGADWHFVPAGHWIVLGELGAELRDRRRFSRIAWTVSLSIIIPLFVGFLLLLTGCAEQKAIVRTEQVEVTKYVKQPVDPSLTAPIVVNEPPPTCNDGVSVVFCGPELILARLMWKAAVQSCNTDRQAIRDGE